MQEKLLFFIIVVSTLIKDVFNSINNQKISHNNFMNSFQQLLINNI